MTETTSVRVGELGTLSDLRAEVAQVASVLEELGPSVQALVHWATTLPERLQEAPFSTSGLASSVESVAETVGGLDGLTALEDAADELSIVNREITRAEGLGEAADELGATGDVKAFTGD